MNSNEVDETKVANYLLTEVSTAKRTELKALETSASVYENVVKMNKSVLDAKAEQLPGSQFTGKGLEIQPGFTLLFCWSTIGCSAFAAGKTLIKPNNPNSIYRIIN